MKNVYAKLRFIVLIIEKTMVERNYNTVTFFQNTPI